VKIAEFEPENYSQYSVVGKIAVAKNLGSRLGGKLTKKRKMIVFLGPFLTKWMTKI
jgi:hypothetical protein